MQGSQVIVYIIHTSRETKKCSIKDVKRINKNILEAFTSWEPVLTQVFQRVRGTHAYSLVPCNSPDAEGGPAD